MEWTSTKQECIPVGCVPPTSVAAFRERVSAWGDLLGGCLPREVSASGVSTQAGCVAPGPRGRHPHCTLGYTHPAVNRMTDRQV